MNNNSSSSQPPRESPGSLDSGYTANLKDIVSSWAVGSSSLGHTSKRRNSYNQFTQDAARKSEERYLPESLEGTLYFRKGKALGATRSWKQRYVVLDLTDGGSISCYKQSKAAAFVDQLASPSSSLFGKKTYRRVTAFTSDSRKELTDADIKINASLEYTAKDIENDAYGFLIEIDTEEFVDFEEVIGRKRSTSEDFSVSIDLAGASKSSDSIDLSIMSGSMNMTPTNENEDSKESMSDEIVADLRRAKKAGKPLRYYFRCNKSSNEKVLWLSAFHRINRFSSELRTKHGIYYALSNPNLLLSHSRLRSDKQEHFAKESRRFGSYQLTDPFEESGRYFEDPDDFLAEQPSRPANKEYLVYPTYAYPNRWMTHKELREEMMKTSKVFHDLRLSSAPQKEIGVLKVEVLQCVGLPPLDFASETDAVVYLVCGQYAFSTDVIWNKLNPIWLPQSRRAAIFPLFHGYARLFAGVFDDDGKKEKDDFAGRVVIDLSRCRPRSVYDVTLPLRQSAHVYSKRPNGSIRLRFSIVWHSEHDALMSYIPKRIRKPTSVRPNDDTTILCADEKAFRNITTTVHGVHMPGRFSFQQWRATLREVNFSRKMTIRVVRKLVFDTVVWEYPTISLFLFCAWMHCVYSGAFSLVLPYSGCFLLLIMMQNYAFYNTDGKIHNGFIPPSFEELLFALIRKGRGQAIAPLEMKATGISRGSSSSALMRAKSRRVSISPSSGGPIPMEYETKAVTHRFKGLWLLRLLGLKRDNVEGENLHMEFPLSRNLHYTKFTVKESIFEKTTLLSKMKSEDDVELEDLGGVEDAKSKGRKFMGKVSSKHQPELEKRDSYDRGLEEVKGDLRSRFGDEKATFNERSMWALGEKQITEEDVAKITEDIPKWMIIPEQDIDVLEKKKKKKLSEDLLEIRDNLHRATFHLFNDRTHLIAHPNACYFGQAKRADAWKLAHTHTENALDKLLNTGQYSSSNPVVARVGLYVEPIIQASHSGLGLFRSIYNILTWRDPFLSFWFVMILGAATLVMFIFPWRLFLGITGLVVVGPQNFVLNQLEKRGKSPTFVKKIQAKIKEQKEKQRNKQRGTEALSSELPIGQPIISAHSEDGTPPLELTRETADAREIHRVSVPYGQLRYNRMYDWPPEAQYARVQRSDLNGDVSDGYSTNNSRPMAPPQRNQSAPLPSTQELDGVQVPLPVSSSGMRTPPPPGAYKERRQTA